jgi:CPA1 family monovalent cation:H+ antiporter
MPPPALSKSCFSSSRRIRQPRDRVQIRCKCENSRQHARCGQHDWDRGSSGSAPGNSAQAQFGIRSIRMELSIVRGLLLLLMAASVVAMMTRRLRLPYSVGLVATGMALALLPFAPKISFTKDLIFSVLLPPLIFEAAFYLRWNELRRELPVILTLASAGVALSGAVTAVGMHYFAGWEWPGALVFGSLIAATDPVSVIATFREAKVHGRLRLLIEAESLFNDGTAAVAFGIAVLFAMGEGLTTLGLMKALLTTVGGALLCGVVVGAVALFLTKRTEDHLVELTFTMVAAYGSFLLAEGFHFSGVFATITAGLIIGNWGPLGALSNQGREAVQAFWEFAAFVANSLVFLLIGMEETSQHFAALWLPVAVGIVFVILGRAVSVYPMCVLFARSGLRVTLRHQHALLWGGLRGALALALALGLPIDLPRRAEIITVSFAVVAFSVFVQGLTILPLLRAIGEIPRTTEGESSARG